MNNQRLSRVLFIFALVFAGEMIFSLPFHTTRYFRPTFLDVFDFSNTQLGDVFAFYGVTAMFSYYIGGPIADRFSPRGLMVFSLATTSAGGLYLLTVPGFVGTATVFGWWGITTIFLFWAAMIRATREWGGDLSQGLAFGILDGGRGIIAAAMAVFAVTVFALYMPDDARLASDAERLAGFRSVIIFYSGSTLLAAVLVWLIIPPMTPPPFDRRPSPLNGMLQVMRRPVAWTHALVIIAAYCGYKGLDNYSLYAVQVLGMDEVEAARFTAWAGYLRPVGCIAAGIVADRVGAALTSGVSFVLLIVIYGVLSFAAPSPFWTNVIFANLLVSYLAIYAFRGLYYALLEETRVPKHLTGTTVGFVAFLGYTPDAFFGPVTGRILDAAPGLPGHQNFFLFLTLMSFLGLIAVIALAALNRRLAAPAV
ncbi:MAG: MFS transporter [Gammaproteobacteria bacterium]|nr:MFS transporter [Gammaproteobacteria bacterium]